MNFRRTVYECALAGTRLSERVARGFLYFGAGTLNQRDLREMAARSWRRFAVDPDFLFSGLNGLEEKLYLPWIAAGDRLCVIGAGTGRDVLPFVDKGHDVVCVEPSPEPVEILRGLMRDRGQADNVVQAFIEEASLPGTFDVVLFSMQCYGYIQGSRERIAVLRKLAAHLNPGGRILVTYRTRSSDWDGPAMRLASLASTLTRSDWRLEPHDMLSRMRDDDRAIQCEHIFVPEEIEQEILDAGLRLKMHEHKVSPYLAVVIQ
jgi:SAM-dependent methyltransferase